MSERDWELSFEEFDWGVADKSDSSEADDGAGDAELRELFSTFDDLHASEALRRTTLAAVLDSDNLDTDDQGKEDSVQPARRGTRMRRRRREGVHHPRRLRALVCAACVVVLLVGMASWFVPLTTVAVAQDELSVSLGVNVYGVTVWAESEGALSNQVMAQAKVEQRGIGDALTRVFDAYDELHQAGASAEATVEVSSAVSFGGEGVRKEAQHVVEGRSRATQHSGSASPDSRADETPTMDSVGEQTNMDDVVPDAMATGETDSHHQMPSGDADVSAPMNGMPPSEGMGTGDSGAREQGAPDGQGMGGAQSGAAPGQESGGGSRQPGMQR